MQAPRRTTAVRERAKERARHHPYNGAMVLAFLLGFCLAQCAPVAFAHMNEPPPQNFSAAACSGLVQGRRVARSPGHAGKSICR